MLKVVFCLRRRPDMSREEFFAYWNGTHAALSFQTREAMRVKRYVQNLTIDNEMARQGNAVRGGLPEFDGVAEAWFESLEDLARIVETEDGRNAMQVMFEDEPNFIDLANSTFFIVEEHEIY